MKRILVCFCTSHTWFWPQVCVTALTRFPPVVPGHKCKIVCVDNSPDWSPAIKGITETRLGKHVEVYANPKANRFHATGLDAALEKFDCDYFMALESDVAVLKHGWLPWFLEQLESYQSRYAAGAWHHEQFVNPSCTLYRASVLRDMLAWCKANQSDVLRWGESFEKTAPLNWNLVHDAEDTKRQALDWLSGPFAEKRGWPEGTVLKERPSGQTKGPGWFEPAQQLHHWAVEAGHTYRVCDTSTYQLVPGLPVQTFYGGESEQRTMEIHECWGRAFACHFWGGTRALDIIKHPVDDPFVKEHMPFWLQREARFWRDTVDADVREQTVALIRQHGWHTRSCFGGEVNDRDRQAVQFVHECYAKGQVVI